MQGSDNFELLPPASGARGAVSAPHISSLGFQENPFTWEQLGRVLRKNFWFGFSFAFFLTGLVVAYAFLQKDFYRPTARLEIAPPSSGIKTVNEIESAPEADNLDYFQTQAQILASDALAVSVIRDLHLDKNPEYAGHEPANAHPAQNTENAAVDASPNPPAILQEQFDLANLTPSESIALERFRRDLSVSPVRNTRLIEISFSSHDPRVAQTVTNTLVTKFIDQNYRHRYTTTMQASAWLSSQLNDLQRKVNDSAQAVADYQKKYGLVEVDDRDVPLSQLMNDISRQYSDAQAARIEAEAYIRMIDDGHGEAVPALRDDKLYQDLMARYSDLRTQLAQAKTVYGDANVNVQKLQDQINEISLQIDAERNRSFLRTRSSYSAALDRQELLAREREKLRANMGHMSSQLAAYHMLKNEANASAQLYNTLEGRLREAGIYAGLGSSNMRVVDLAMNLRKPTGPHRVLLVTFGAIISCICALVLSITRESFRHTLSTPEDVKSWTGLPSLALLPAMENATTEKALPPPSNGELSGLLQASGKTNEHNLPRVSIMQSLTAEAEAIRDLRTTLLNSKRGHAPSVFLISSAMEGEGKTTVAVNFALALAQLGKTCLVDADLRQPAIARAFKIQTKSGLTDHLMKSSPLNAALVYVAAHQNLTILPSGAVSKNPADLLSSPEMEQLLETLKKFFEYTVIDSPPVIPFSDARYLSSLADAVVLVGRYEMTTRRALQRSTELLSEVHAPVAGVVLNGVDLSSPDYNYYTHSYRKWQSKRAQEAFTDGSGTDGPGHGGTPGAMSAHA
jgi:polysaccharide biosynthesis transport protein